VVCDGETVFAKGYGYRDTQSKAPLNEATSYPIASTTKALNATLIGMLVQEGRLAWDTPVRRDVPRFRLRDELASVQATLRDLLTMRTGLPRHDLAWIDNPAPREGWVERVAHLSLSAGFRERFQYSNLSATLAGHVAECVAGQSWEELLGTRIFSPLGMRASSFGPPVHDNVTRSYHENHERCLVETPARADGDTAPSGSVVHSTVQDMARWVAFNLSGGGVAGRALIDEKVLREIQSPQMVVGADPSATSPLATYGMGWFIDCHRDVNRISHGGYLRDVNTEISLFPDERIGVVSFLNFGCSIPARLVNEAVFDSLTGNPPGVPFDDKLDQYERRIDEARRRWDTAQRVAGTTPSHRLDAYVGSYYNPGYGLYGVERHEAGLALRRNQLLLPLEHWHYDYWVARKTDLFTIQGPYPFDRNHPLSFLTDGHGEISTLCMRLEPAVPAIEFQRRNN
jgi:CubicO group peptidase (beta-lactamase class C family)